MATESALATVSPKRLVGREVEVSVIQQVVGRAVDGAGSVVWIEGEPGIGKSALAAAMAGLAREGGAGVWHAVADELMAWFPLRLMADCLGVVRQRERAEGLEGIRAEIAGLLRGDRLAAPAADPVLVAGERMLDLVDRLCALGPQVVIVEDLQWADEASLRLWGRLAASVDQIPLLLVGVSRPAGGSAVLDRLAERARRSGVVLRPTALNAYQVARLAGSMIGGVPGPRLSAELDRAQGNPLYVVKLVEALKGEGLIGKPGGRAVPAGGAVTSVAGPGDRDGLDDGIGVVEFTGRSGAMPDSLAAVIEARLAFLDFRVSNVLRLAALLGIGFDVAQLAAVSGLAVRDLATVLAAAQDAGVLEPAGERLVFRHVLIQQVLVEQMSKPVRRALHKEIALTLVRAGASLDAVARHLLAVSGPFEVWVAAWLLTVPVTALYGAPRVADELLTRAMEAAHRADADWLMLAVNLAHVRFWLGRDQSVVEIAREVVRRTEDIDRRALMWALAARAAGRAGSFREVAVIAEQALAAPGLPSSWQARIECWYAIALKYSGSADRARRMAEASLAHALVGDDRLSIAYARHAMQWCAPSDTTTELLAQAGDELGEDAESSDLRMMILTNDALRRYRTARNVAVRETIVSELLVQTERMTAARAALIFRFAAGIRFEDGRWDEAMGYLAGMEPEVATMPFNIDCYGLRALIHLLRGDRSAATRELAEVDRVFAEPEMAPQANTLLVEYVLSTRAVLAETAGDPATAFALLEESIRGALPDEVRGARFSVFIPELVRLGLLLGRLDAAERTVRALEQLLETERSLFLTAAAKHAAALLVGNPVALVEAADMYGSTGLRLRRGSALEEAAVLFAEAGSVDRARAALTSAADCYTEMGAVLLLRRLESRLRRFGIRRGPRSHHRRARSGWAALTQTERAVAEILAQGKSNPEIAAQLFLSRYTVQAHVSRILAKLGYTSRIDVARAFADGSLPGPDDEHHLAT